jgi:two-component system sensor histidine kinase/response regulator
MMSPIDEKGFVERCQEIGIRDYVQKPIRQHDLFRTLMLSLGKMKHSEIKETPKSNSKASVRNLRIILAEDNIINQKVAVSLLENWGHEVTVVNDGREAVDSLQQQNFDLVLMDVQMPNMDGLEATRRIRNATSSKINSRIPIIAMTAHAMKGDRENFLAAGMDDYISKPINVDEVLNILNKYAAINE